VTNVGNIDGAARLLTRFVLIALFLPPASAPVFSSLGPWRVLLAVGVVMLATAALRFCPACTLPGVNTCPRRRWQLNLQEPRP